MQGNMWVVDIYLGTLAANSNGVVPIPFACQLVGAALVGTNANDATLDCGTVADADGILDGVDAGDSSAAAYYTHANFNGALATAGQPYPFAAQAELAWTIDYDGSSGTAIQKSHLQFVFTQ